MSYEGQYYKQGDKLCTTYPEKGEAMWSLVEDYYNSQYGFSKSAGSAVYTTDRMNGYHNAIYGKYITAAMFMSDNVFASLGARPTPMKESGSQPRWRHTDSPPSVTSQWDSRMSTSETSSESVPQPSRMEPSLPL